MKKLRPKDLLEPHATYEYLTSFNSSKKSNTWHAKVEIKNALGKILIPINISLANNNAKGNIITENSSTLEFKLQTPMSTCICY